MTETTPTGLLRLKTVLQILQISKSSFYAGIKAGMYPAPVSIGLRARRWRQDDILALVAHGVQANR